MNSLSRLTQLLLLAVTVLVYNVVAMAIANSLFVTRVGAGDLPYAFILIGLCSLPAYAFFSQIIDRYSRPQLFRYILLISILIFLTLRFCLNWQLIPIYYLLLIFVFFLWDFSNNILYPSLLRDYFTSLEYKQSAPFIGIAQAVGTMLGGAMTIICSGYITTTNLIFLLPIILAIAFGQLIYLENSQRRVDKVQTSTPVGIIESLRSFPDLGQRYRLVFFLASSSFLLVIIYISSEFIWFNIYGQHFTAEGLTSFLGLMRIVISIVQVVVLYLVTRPLLAWLGVARMNPVYPLTTLASFSALLAHLGLGTAIGLHVNGDALYKAINLPVHQLNYNGIPNEFVGRVRTLSDGVIYAVGLTTAGIVLWLCHIYLSLEQITWLAIALTLLLLILRLPMGKFYAEGLEKMIRSNIINLDDFNTLRTQLPPQSSNAIRQLLTNEDRYVQLKGLDLACNIENPSQFLPEVKQILLKEQEQLKQGVVEFLVSNSDQQIVTQLHQLLHRSSEKSLRTTALEVLIIDEYKFSEPELNSLRSDQEPQIVILTAIATIINHSRSTEVNWSSLSELSPNQSTLRSILRIMTYNPHSLKLLPWIEKLLPQANDEIKTEGLKALSKITNEEQDNCRLAQIALPELSHPQTSVRIAAFELLQTSPCNKILPHLQTGLADSHPRVRQQVAKTLAVYGQEGLSLAQSSLSSPELETVNTAIATIAQIKTRKANDILFGHLSPEFEQLYRTRKWQEQIPAQHPHWRFLAIAIEDYHQSLIQKVLYVLSCLGYARTVNAINRILVTADQTDLANAVELLVSLRHRRFVMPLVPLLEKMVKSSPSSAPEIELNPRWLRKRGYKLLLEALESKQRWIRAGALIALAQIPSTLLEDREQVVRMIAQEIFPSSEQLVSPTHSFMNRLLLLKNVPLFKNLSLDELFLIDQSLEQRQVLSNEIIYTEGSWGEYLYIIAEGKVKIVKRMEGQEKEIKQLSQGQYFGEIALFDNATRWDGAIALEDCTLLKLEKKRFISLITQRPHIILEICRFLSERLRDTDKYMSLKMNNSEVGSS